MALNGSRGFRFARIGVLLAAAVLLEIFVFNLLQTSEHRVQDALLRAHAERRVPDPRIELVLIDERSLAELAPDFGRYPWPRAVYAEWTEALLAQQPAAVVFDLVVADADRERPDSDAYFIDAATATDRTYFPLVLLPDVQNDGLEMAKYADRFGFRCDDREGERPDARMAMVLPLAALAETGRTGSINFLEDADGLGRHITVQTRSGGYCVPSLAARVARGLGADLPSEDSVRLNWRGAAGTRTAHSFSEVFHGLTGRATPTPFDFRDKVVVLGVAAAGLPDFRSTPLSSLHLGPEILATGIETLINGDALQVPSHALQAALCLGAVALVLMLAAWLGVAPLGLGLVALTAAGAAAAYVALDRNLQWPVLTPATFAWLSYLGSVGEGYWRERNSRLRTEKLFGRFLDPRVVQQLVSGDDLQAKKKPVRCDLSVLFSDIRGFTSFSEKHTPEEVVDLINRYFSRQVEVIFRHGGTLDKFIGDAIMAFWGAPNADPQHARRAVAAALEMAREVEAFRAELAGTGIEFDVGIGIHSGEAVVGFIGADQRLDYTAIGDTVNLASRIEGETKGRARILVTEATRKACENDYHWTSHGSVKVKGRAEPVNTYEPRGRT